MGERSGYSYPYPHHVLHDCTVYHYANPLSQYKKQISTDNNLGEPEQAPTDTGGRERGREGRRKEGRKEGREEGREGRNEGVRE